MGFCSDTHCQGAVASISTAVTRPHPRHRYPRKLVSVPGAKFAFRPAKSWKRRSLPVACRGAVLSDRDQDGSPVAVFNPGPGSPVQDHRSQHVSSEYPASESDCPGNIRRWPEKHPGRPGIAYHDHNWQPESGQTLDVDLDAGFFEALLWSSGGYMGGRQSDLHPQIWSAS